MRRIAFILFLVISIPAFSQQIISNNPLINEAFNLAVKTVDINILRGILAAGADYGGDWTRDRSPLFTPTSRGTRNTNRADIII